MSEETTPMAKVEILRACCCVAGADGQTTDDERRILEQLADGVGVGQASLAAMIERSEKDKCFCDEQFRILKAEPQQTMSILLQTAMANGILKDEEKTVLEKLSVNLEVPPDVFAELVEQVASLTNG